MRVLVCDPWAQPSRVQELGASLVSLEELQRQADVISLHLPLTKESISMVDTGFLSSMKPGSFLVNTARGGLVDEAALIEALQSGHLGGAIVDVFPNEPLPADDPLWRAPNLIVTPHMASVASSDTIGLQVAQNVRRLLKGEALANFVDVSRGY